MLATRWQRNHRNIGDGQELLKFLPDACVKAAFFDPQYRGLIDKMGYGDVHSNASKMGRSHALTPMPEWMIRNMIIQIERALLPSAYLFFWIDKFILVEGVAKYTGLTNFTPVDMITWDKQRLGMGYRSRRKSEYLVCLQKPPIKAKATWKDHGIPDVWPEPVVRGGHIHAKPIKLQTRLIECVTEPGDLVIDPCAGSFSVLKACDESGRAFLGTDLTDH